MKAVQLEFPTFATAPQAEPVILFDAEAEVYQLQQSVTVLGWYQLGELCVKQILFSEPFPASALARTAFFRDTFLKAGTALGAYYADFEANLFGVPVPIEVMPRPYAAKESVIAIETLSTERGKDLPRWGAESWLTIAFHNLSCIVKVTLLYLGRNLFASPEFQLSYEEAARRAYS
jgi:hypothetical protein